MNWELALLWEKYHQTLLNWQFLLYQIFLQPNDFYFSFVVSVFVESWNHLGWKRPLRSLSPTINLTLPCPPLNHVPKRHVYMSFIYFQGQCLDYFHGQPVPVLDNPFGEEIFPNSQSEPPLMQLEAISSLPIVSDLGEGPTPDSLQPPFR